MLKVTDSIKELTHDNVLHKLLPRKSTSGPMRLLMF